MAARLGKLEPFDDKLGNWETYQERLEIFFTANEIKEDAKKIPLLLSYLGPNAYATLRNLLAPEKPASQTYKKLIETLDQHYAPKPLVIAERFRFHRRRQGENESVSAYMAELRKLASSCKFGNYLEEALRDRLVCGLRAEHIQKRLLSEADLTLKKALELALAMEMATKDATELQHKKVEMGIHKFGKPRQSESKKCYRCGVAGHSKDKCRFKDAVCHQCGKTGHIKKVCRELKSSPTRATQRHHKPNNKPVKTMDKACTEDSEFLLVGTLGLHSMSDDVIWVNPQIEGQHLKMELDTGAAVSVISHTDYHQKFKHIPLKETDVRLKTYTGENVAPLGKIKVNVSHNEQTFIGNLYVVKNGGMPLFGREWLSQIRLDWQTIKFVNTQHTPCANTDLNAVLQNHQGAFQEGIGKLQGIQAKLNLKDNAQPKFQKARQVPYAMRPKVEQELARLQEAGILSPVETSDWATPIVPILKSNGTVRICGDFKSTVNPMLNVEQYPLPRIEDIFSNLAGGEHFTKLDLTQAYLQMEVDLATRELLTINTHRGLFRYNRLCYGIASAPAIWQRAMEQVLQGIPGTQVILDDMIITGKTKEEHIANLNQVLTRLEEKGLRLNKSKCEFFKDEIIFCGHKINAKGIHMTDDKVDAVNSAPAPTNVSELRAFLGLVNYYHRFLPNLSTMLHPLHQLLVTDEKWEWNEERQEAFNSAKKLITSKVVLTHYNPELPVTLAADASPYGIGAVLSHTMPGGEERPIAYASRSLSKAEKNYAQIDKEALAIVWSVKKFQMYLSGRKFKLVTDHKPLTSIFHPQKNISATAAARLQRYAVFLAGHDYTIEYRSTTEHCNADGLSRLPTQRATEEEPEMLDMLYTDMEMSQFFPLPVTSQQVKLQTQRDSTLSKAYEATRLGWKGISDTDLELKPFHNRKDELTLTDGCLMWGLRVIIPAKLRSQVLDEIHDGHMGVVKMKAVARNFVWWPGIDQDIEKMVKGCSGCQQVQNMPSPAPLHVWEWPTSKWDRIHVDYAGPFQGQMFLVIVDAHSKWPFVISTHSTTSTRTIQILQSIFASEGLPKQLVSDNGTQFTSEEFETFLKRNGVKHICSAPYHPSTNGLAERFVQSFKQALKSAKKERGSVQTKLTNFLLAYRNAPHSTTGIAPAVMFRGHSLRSRLDLLKPNVKDLVNNKQAACRKGTETRRLRVGQVVSVRDYRGTDKWIPGVVYGQTGPVSYQVKVGPDMVWRRHVDQILDADIGQPVQFQKPPEPAFVEYPAPVYPSPKASDKPTSDSAKGPDDQVKNTKTPVASTSNQRQDQGASTKSPVQRRYPRRDRHAPDKLNL